MSLLIFLCLSSNMGNLIGLLEKQRRFGENSIVRLCGGKCPQGWTPAFLLSEKIGLDKYPMGVYNQNIPRWGMF